MEPINLGFIGLGPRGRSLYQSLVFNPRMEERVFPVAALDPAPEIAADWRFRVEKTYSNLESFLAHQNLDAVLVASPAPTHPAIVIRCLEAGLDVWSEVPMGFSLEDLHGIIDAVQGNKGRRGQFALGENYCWLPEVQFLAMQHEGGKIGDIFYAEGEYSHSVEHYMITENFLHNQEIDPEYAPEVHPTWRATLSPITYGHTFGPILHVLNRNPRRLVEKPVTVCGLGNMKMQKRFGTHNFQQCLVNTNQDTICKFASGFVLPHHGRTCYGAWATRGVFESGYDYRPGHYYLEIPPNQAKYPLRHQVQGKHLTDEDICSALDVTAQGGHRGADPLMLEAWVNSLQCKGDYPIPAPQGAEMTAIGIYADQAIKEKKIVEIPKFR